MRYVNSTSVNPYVSVSAAELCRLSGLSGRNIPLPGDLRPAVVRSLGNAEADVSMKLRFEYPLEGVSVEEFKLHWSESFYREMMTYPVLNRLDREQGIQYYYQKGNLVIRDKDGSRMERIPEADRVEKLSEIFHIAPDLVDRALGILQKDRV